MRKLLIFLIALGLAIPSIANETLIPFKILGKEENAHYKLSLDIEVPLVEGRLPSKLELGAISQHLVSKERRHERTFVLFYLPGMEVGAGAFATAHHNPAMQVKVLPYMLMDYPEYAKLLK